MAIKIVQKKGIEVGCEKFSWQIRSEMITVEKIPEQKFCEIFVQLFFAFASHKKACFYFSY